MENKISPPNHLESPESAFYAQMISEYGIADSGGLALLLAACESAARARKCRERIDADGELSESGKVHQLMNAERDNRKAFVSTINSMGLDIETTTASVGRPVASPAVRRVR